MEGTNVGRTGGCEGGVESNVAWQCPSRAQVSPVPEESEGGVHSVVGGTFGAHVEGLEHYARNG